MTIDKMKKQQFLSCLNLVAAALIILIALAGPAAAQSSDLDNPTPMTTNEVKGRWPKGKAVSYFFSFVGGPGEVRVMIDFVTDELLQNVFAQVTDAYGRPFASLDPQPGADLTGGKELSYFATTAGQRLIGRYEIKRRQKLVVKVSIPGDDIVSGRYKVRVEGDGVSFNQDDGSTNNSTSNNSSTNNSTSNPSAGSKSLTCLPKSGKLRLVMDDGTVQEINLSRVRETSIKP